MKRNTALILVIVFCIMMISCAKTTEPIGTAEPGTDAAPEAGTAAPSDGAAEPGEEATSAPAGENTAAPSEPGKPLRYSEVYDPETDYNNRYGRGSACMAESPEAYLFTDAGYYCYYYDQAAEESGVLCGKPECMHDVRRDKRECNGYIGSNSRWLNYCEGHVYYTAIDGDRAYLYRMDPDGTGREKLIPRITNSRTSRRSSISTEGPLLLWQERGRSQRRARVVLVRHLF